jgi:hypothetical protein
MLQAKNASLESTVKALKSREKDLLEEMDGMQRQEGSVSLERYQVAHVRRTLRRRSCVKPNLILQASQMS